MEPLAQCAPGQPLPLRAAIRAAGMRNLNCSPNHPLGSGSKQAGAEGQGADKPPFPLAIVRRDATETEGLLLFESGCAELWPGTE